MQDGEKGSFARKLRHVIAECERILQPDRLLAFTYHHPHYLVQVHQPAGVPIGPDSLGDFSAVF